MTHEDVDFAFFTVDTAPRTYCVVTRGQKFALRGRVLLWSRRDSANGATMATDDDTAIDWPGTVQGVVTMVAKEIVAPVLKAKSAAEAHAVTIANSQLEAARLHAETNQKAITERETTLREEIRLRDDAVREEAKSQAETERKRTEEREATERRRIEERENSKRQRQETRRAKISAVEETRQKEIVALWQARKGYAEAVAVAAKEQRLAREITMRWFGTFAIILVCVAVGVSAVLIKTVPAFAVAVFSALSASVLAWRVNRNASASLPAAADAMALPQVTEKSLDAGAKNDADDQ